MKRMKLVHSYYRLFCSTRLNLGLLQNRCVRSTGRSKDIPSSDSSTGEPLKDERLQKNERTIKLPINTDAPYPSPKVPSDVELFRLLDQTKHSFRPKSVSAKDTSIIVFPGQGSQFVGMGSKLIEFETVKQLFATASNILGYDLLSLCLNGPKQELNKTVYCQPAVFVCSMAAVEKLRFQNPQAIENCIATAGFSVGEFAALVFAGSLSFEDAVKLVKIRAEAMQSCSEMEPSGLLTVFQRASSRLDLAIEGALEWVKSQGRIKEPVCQIANFLFTRCKVIGGHEEALKFVEDNAAEFDLRCKRVPVSGAFHTRLMKPAAKLFKEEIEKYKINETLINVHSNLDGKKYRSSREIKRKLTEQIFSPIKWEQTNHILYDRDFFHEFPTTYECGPGKQLYSMLRQTNALKFVEENSSKFDIKCKRVDVSGAFHTRLMKPAGEILKKEITKFSIKTPKINVHSNLDGEIYKTNYAIAKCLVKQVSAAVDWESTMNCMYDETTNPNDVPTTYECGPGKQLGAMLKQTNKKAYELYKNVLDD